MKFQLTFKTPDVLDQLGEVLEENERDEAAVTAKKYLRYGEYLSVEFDTETQDATVIMEKA